MKWALRSATVILIVWRTRTVQTILLPMVSTILFLYRRGDCLNDERGADVLCTESSQYPVYVQDSFILAVEDSVEES